MTIGLAATSLVKLAKQPQVISFAHEIAGRAYSVATKLDDPLLKSITSKISDHGSIAESIAEDAKFLKVAKVIGAVGCAVALAKAVHTGIERAEKGESLNPLEVISSAASKTVSDISDTLAGIRQAVSKGELAEAAYGSAQAALTVSSLPKDFALGIAAEIGGHAIGIIGKETAENQAQAIMREKHKYAMGASMARKLEAAKMASEMRSAMESVNKQLRTSSKITLTPSAVPMKASKSSNEQLR